MAQSSTRASRPARASRAGESPPPAGSWLLLVQQLPARPSNARVKTWRRLQQLGALAIKPSVYILPNSPQTQEDFEWMKAEILGMKGQATVFAADSIDALTREEIVAAFRQARQQDFAALRRQAGRLGRQVSHPGPLRGSRLRKMQRAARAARERLAQIEEINFFAAPGRDEAAAAIADLESRITGAGTVRADVAPAVTRLKPEAYRHRIWVTRPRPGIDRMGSAWLIRRFIDPDAKFGFVVKPEGRPATDVPFDMFDVEFSHHGGHCTFEVLAERFGIDTPAVRRLGEIVHDLDLKQTGYGAPEAPALGRIVAGLRQAYDRDEELLEQGIVVFEALYRSFTDDPHLEFGRQRRSSVHRRTASRRKGT